MPPATPLPSTPDSYFGALDAPSVAPRVHRPIRLGLLDPATLAAPAPAPDPDVTAIIPARNEAETIAAVVQACREYAAHVIVIDGSSTDATPAVAAAAGARVLRDHGQGKGAALIQAAAAVTTPYLVFVDADGSHDPIDIPRLVAPLRANQADHVGGSRLLGGSDELHGGGDEFLRLAGSAFITYLINLRFGSRLSDSQNGFRALRTDLFHSLRLRSRHTTIEMEMIMATLARGARLAEVPTHERARTAGYSKISLASPLTWLSYGSHLVRGLCTRRTAPTP
ncbi:MAG: glycosyltransferase family 2 protein [Verrucomicrobia bacterium]|nr:glycosyltransferase family 2 protein [Verrucomicrobiota bacterium]